MNLTLYIIIVQLKELVNKVTYNSPENYLFTATLK